MDISHSDEIRELTIEESLTNAAFPAFLGAVLAILAVLASVAGIGTCAGRRESVERKLADEKNRQQDL
jgi:hypothetical protein